MLLSVGSGCCTNHVISKRISARLWMRDLLSHCMCVCTYVLVTLRNVNWRYCLGMSIWGHAQNVNLRSCPGRISDTCITRRWNDISWWWKMGRTARLVLRDCGVKCINECWTQLTAGNSERKKAKKSAHHRCQQSDRRTRKSSKVESTYWRFFTSQVFRLTLHVSIVLYRSLDSH